METHLGLKIRKIREIKNLDQTYLAKKLGISQSAYSDLEKGKVKINDTKLSQIAEALEVTPEVIKYFNDAVAFNSCIQSGYSNTYHINPLDKITELYDKLLHEKDLRIQQLHKELELMKIK
jgi:transcriptional regulator with XRE-family HTH domain